MPDGFVQTAHFRNTSDYVQISGTFDWTKMNLNPYDCGGEPGDYQEPGFTNCQADLDLPVGVYNASYTFAQGASYTPPAVTAPASSSCTTVVSPTPSGVTYSWAHAEYGHSSSYFSGEWD
ncbi:hypothetical protein MNV49_005539 [Pseudohyphozyma bogoriensis]|nr:hypothetical protein MNV49_005539 [Pseudohyphozyma bogoriensis]